MENVLFEDLFFPTGGLRLCEAKESRYPGVLGVVEGPFGITEDANRNKRTYTNDFWEKVLARPGVAGKIEERAMVGEPEHPHSLHARLDRVSHVITDLKLLPEKNTIWGKAEILDTPTGRILKTLFDARVKVGISSRGSGSLEEINGRSLVKESGYLLGGFDFVSEPSAQNAYPHLSERLIESLIGHPDLPEIRKKSDLSEYYERLLGKFGVSLNLLNEGLSGNDMRTTSDVSKESVESAATIAQMQTQKVGLLTRCKDLSIQLEEANGRVQGLEVLRLEHDAIVEKCDSLSSMLFVLKAEKTDLEAALSQSERSMEGVVEAQEGHWKSKLKNLEHGSSQKVSILREKLEKASEEVGQLKEALQGSDKKVSRLEGRLKEKNEKLKDYRKSLIENVCSLLNVDPADIVNVLPKGFSPKDLVEAVQPISPLLLDSTLPLSPLPGSPGFELLDTAAPKHDDGRPKPGPNFKRMVATT